MPPIDDHRRHALYTALTAALGHDPADTLISMLPPRTWDELVTKHDLDHSLEVLEHKLMGTIHRELRDQTRTLAVGMVGAMAAMTSVCIAAITLAT